MRCFATAARTQPHRGSAVRGRLSHHPDQHVGNRDTGDSVRRQRDERAGYGFVNPSLDLLFGPLFTLPTVTVMTEIGGFVETCIEPCSTPLPGRVEIHPAVNGAPDL